MAKLKRRKRESQAPRGSELVLPVIQPKGLRPRRPSFWRTISLIAVHVVMIGHAAQWLLQGITISPLEPSEGMELAKHGVVNTGLVFFVAAIIVTAVFGRFFCGWGCHLIALQDLSRWILIKVGIRPRPIRSRLLGLVPLIAFVYMFLWPAIYKAAVGAPLGPVKTGFLTTDFWATFPGLVVAVLTFVVCGFVVVFVLGSKGYCAYGCPYGAAFGMADRIAPIRVRVTDACQGCATCTAVCTSNVRVHEEVRDHGMVVDPGCMKCLDCVANCPNDALYVGAGRPAVGRGGGRRGPGSLSWPEEALAGIVFVLAFVVFRGLYGMVPFLFSLGLAAILAGLGVITWRLMRRDDAWLGPIRLKTSGRIRPAGRFFVALMVPILVFWAHSGVVRVLDLHGKRLYDATGHLRFAALEIQRPPTPPTDVDRRLVATAASAIARFEAWSLVETPDHHLRAAWLAFLSGHKEKAGSRVDRAIEGAPLDHGAHMLAGRLLVVDGRWEDAARAYSRAVDLNPSDPVGYLSLGTVLGQTGQFERAREVFGRGLEVAPTSVDLRYNIGLTLALSGDLDGAVREFRRVLDGHPDHRPSRENLAGALAQAGRFEEAVPVFEEAVRRSPEDPRLRVLAAQACLGAGLRSQAEVHIEEAIRLDPTMEPARRLIE